MFRKSINTKSEKKPGKQKVRVLSLSFFRRFSAAAETYISPRCGDCERDQFQSYLWHTHPENDKMQPRVPSKKMFWHLNCTKCECNTRVVG